MSEPVVVFDLGNVLIPWDIRKMYSRVFVDPKELDYFLSEVLTPEINAQVDLGNSLADVTAALSVSFPDYVEAIDLFRTNWSDCIGDPFPETVALLNELVDQGIRCLALSNFGRDTFASIEEAIEPLISRFDGVVLSGIEGLIKPDPAIYKLLCSRFDVEPSDAFFIDDSAVNIAAAAKLGFGTFLFPVPMGTGAVDLRTEFVRRGLLSR